MSQRLTAVIGSNCFTGSHLVDALLAKGDFVLGLSRSPEKNPMFLPYVSRPSRSFKFHQADLVREPEKVMMLLDEYQPSAVINGAALSEVGLSNHEPAAYYEINTLAVVRLCQELRKRPYLKRYVHISSAEIYGSCPEPLAESAPLNPSTPYAVSKAGADLHLLTLFKNFRFPVNLIRSTNVYGKHQQLYKIIPRTFIYLKQGRKIELHGGGRAVKTWVHIRDLAGGVLKAMERGRPGEIYHFADVNSVATCDLVRKICELTGHDFDSATQTTGERLGQDSRYELNYDKAKKELGWEPKVNFEQGLCEVGQWIDENWPQIQNETLVYVHPI
jgi:dTDP-glucose 4,6-dehydratase